MHVNELTWESHGRPQGANPTICPLRAEHAVV